MRRTQIQFLHHTIAPHMPHLCTPGEIGFASLGGWNSTPFIMLADSRPETWTWDEITIKKSKYNHLQRRETIQSLPCIRDSLDIHLRLPTSPHENVCVAFIFVLQHFHILLHYHLRLIKLYPRPLDLGILEILCKYGFVSGISKLNALEFQKERPSSD